MSNHTEHPKKLALLYTLPSFILLESCSKAETALEYAERADFSFYRGEDYYFYREKKAEAIKKNSLIIDGGNYNYLSLVYAEIPKVY